MIDDLPDGLVARHPVADDHQRVLAVLDVWWGEFKGDAGSLERTLLLPRLYFQHFAPTSFVVEQADGELAAFLIGFLSQTEADAAYVHFAGVDPSLQGRGVGQALYRAFFALARSRGRRYVHCVTSPENAGSQAFHARLGFMSSGILKDYDGPGFDRVAFTIDLAADLVRPPRRLRVLDMVLVVEHHPDLHEPNDRSWLSVVRAPEGLTVVRGADASTPAGERWIALYDADPDHSLDEPGLLAAVLTPLARAGVPVFTASTYHADIVLVPEQRRKTAQAALHSAGFAID